MPDRNAKHQDYNPTPRRAIAEELATADGEVRVIADRLAALDEQKRGLMQEPLTGEGRVSLPSLE